MRRYSPVFRKYLNQYCKQNENLALFDIISVECVKSESSAIVGTLVVKEGKTIDIALFQLNEMVNILNSEKLKLAKRALQFKKRIEEGSLHKPHEQKNEILVYDI